LIDYSLSGLLRKQNSLGKEALSAEATWWWRRQRWTTPTAWDGVVEN